MQLPTHPLLQLAQWPLPPSDKPERKTVEADKRLKAYCAGDADLSLPASTLDVLRVIWAWTSKPDAAVAAVPGKHVTADCMTILVCKPGWPL